jgi:hypothetical protein
MSQDREELLKRANARLAALRKRCEGDPAADPLAAKVQALRRRAAEGKPMYNKSMLADAMKLHDALEPTRRKANHTVLEDE